MAGRAGIIGGAAVPHAPQFFSLPPSEDHDQVARIEQVMGEIGDQLRALEPDLVIIVANDHLENHLLHTVPSFMIHCGAEATGSFSGREFHWPISSQVAADLLRDLQRQGFDPAFSMNASIGYEFGIPLTFLGFDTSTPILPIYVNSYVPPQPSVDRCYALGSALHRACVVQGTRAVVIASGGLSHYPGTELYSHPDVANDVALMDQIRVGNLRALLAFDDAALDRSGNVEARSWVILAGALGDRVPDVVSFEPSWHHVYAIAAWTTEVASAPVNLHYPMTDPRLLRLYEALYALRMEPVARDEWLADPDAFAARWGLAPEQHRAVAELDEAALRSLGVHPLLGFLARLQVDLSRTSDSEPDR
jgi:2,3-dihydroxyphenylpropionate 1,2-dioxygenase